METRNHPHMGDGTHSRGHDVVIGDEDCRERAVHRLWTAAAAGGDTEDRRQRIRAATRC
ncbi:MAG: hypothetical protein ACRDTV_21445 [Mycobacterium sp.]